MSNITLEKVNYYYSLRNPHYSTTLVHPNALYIDLPTNSQSSSSNNFGMFAAIAAATGAAALTAEYIANEKTKEDQGKK